jgi:hypothetical protein
MVRYGRDGGRGLDDPAHPEVMFVAASLDGVPVGAVPWFRRTVRRAS